MAAQYIRWFKEVDKTDVNLIGNKGAILGDMVQASLPIYDGFIITVSAYQAFLRENALETKIKHLLQTISYTDSHAASQVSAHIKKLIMLGQVPEQLIKEVFSAYQKLGGNLHDANVSIYPSGVFANLSTVSLLEQQAIIMHAKGEANLIQKIKENFASMFDLKMILYRHEIKLDQLSSQTAVIVQKMGKEEKSGIMLTTDPVTNDTSKIIINAVYGIVELMFEGKIIPDHYEVDKKHLAIIERRIEKQDMMLQYNSLQNKVVSVNAKLTHIQKISDKEIIELAILGKKLEKHYYFPQDIEWTIENEKIYIVKMKPITTTINNSKNKNSSIFDQLEILLCGIPTSPGIACGPANILLEPKDIHKMQTGGVLIGTEMNEEFLAAFKKAAAIITEKGDKNSYAAIMANKLGIPAVVNAQNATKTIQQGVRVTINGITGTIYKGPVNREQEPANPLRGDTIKTATKVYIALQNSKITEIMTNQADGAVLLYARDIIIKNDTHPKASKKNEQQSTYIVTTINTVEQTCKAFYPKPVIYCLSDLKTNEYGNLREGKNYEPKESNPLLGYHGVFRHLHDLTMLDLELDVIKHLRNKKNITNLSFLLPFVRTVKELEQIKQYIAASGLHRNTSFKLWLGISTPACAILLDKFIDTGIDGIAIDFDNLSSLVLGVDKNNHEIAHGFSDEDEAVLWIVKKIIYTAKKRGTQTSFYGQAVEKSPNLISHLVQWGISSIVVSAEAFLNIRDNIAAAEERLLLNHE